MRFHDRGYDLAVPLVVVGVVGGEKGLLVRMVGTMLDGYGGGGGGSL